MLRTCLQRRDSVRDLFWLGRAQAGADSQRPRRPVSTGSTRAGRTPTLDRPNACVTRLTVQAR